MSLLQKIKSTVLTVNRYEAWTHPETLAAVERVAGCRLVCKLEQDIGHTNIQLTESGLAGLENIPAEPIEPLPGTGDGLEEEDITEDRDTDVVGWHNDMYPFSITVSLNYPSGKGGETALMCADGEIMKAQKPDVGYGVFVHGNLIKHKAVRAIGAQERITMVCSFWPADPLLREDSKLVNTRSISLKPEMYYQWATYRLDTLAARFQDTAKNLREKHRQRKLYGEEVVDLAEFAKWAKEQVAYLERTYDHMV